MRMESEPFPPKNRIKFPAGLIAKGPVCSGRSYVIRDDFFLFSSIDVPSLVLSERTEVINM